MKQKITVLLVGALFILSGFATLAGPGVDFGTITDATATDAAAASTTMQTYRLREPRVTSMDATTTVTLDGAEYLHEDGCPILPYETRTMTFPLGTRIIDVTATVSDVETRQMKHDIAPAAPAVPLNSDDIPEASKGALYESTDPYPAEWVRWNTYGGLRDGKHVTILSLQVFPARYTPKTDTLEQAGSFEVTVTYEAPAEPLLATAGDAYDLLIVAPAEFTDILQPLVQHKEDHGLDTKLVTVDEIYSSAQGRDNAEKIKYYIKDAVEDWGVQYVLLAGGLKSLLMGQDWHVPVRYVHNRMSSEPTYISDLYYADIYDAEGNFSSWDTDDDGVYGEWSYTGRDHVEAYPDVYVGRLACRNTREMDTVVNKIIDYETTAAGSEWFNRVVLAAGDTFNDRSGEDILEGEVTTQRTADILDGFDPVKLWWSEGNLKQSKIVDAISQGSGFVHFSGHGSPGMWMGKDFTDDPSGEYILGLEVYHMQLLQNDGQYGIWVIGGCHNSMFNATLLDSAIGCVMSLTGSPTWYWMPVPECFGWWPVKVRGGGAIATFGCTGLGLGTIGDHNEDGIPDCMQYLLGNLELRFFEQYGDDGVDILGEAWGNAISGYNDAFPPMEDQADMKTVQEWVLLGDPSLKIGGYE
ncbi:MAG: C25 family cysteine peptidase [Thermoplasmatota archaeon]